MKCFEKSLELDENYDWAWAHLGETYKLKDMLDDAVRCLGKAVEISPRYAWALVELGEVLRPASMGNRR